jgi:hypothetical protein
MRLMAAHQKGERMLVLGAVVCIHHVRMAL